MQFSDSRTSVGLLVHSTTVQTYSNGKRDKLRVNEASPLYYGVSRSSTRPSLETKPGDTTWYRRLHRLGNRGNSRSQNLSRVPYRRGVDVLREMAWIGRSLSLETSLLSDGITVCARIPDFRMSHWRDLLRLLAALHDIGDIQAIDAIGMDRSAASQHDAKRTKHSF